MNNTTIVINDLKMPDLSEWSAVTFKTVDGKVLSRALIKTKNFAKKLTEKLANISKNFKVSTKKLGDEIYINCSADESLVIEIYSNGVHYEVKI